LVLKSKVEVNIAGTGIQVLFLSTITRVSLKNFASFLVCDNSLFCDFSSGINNITVFAFFSISELQCKSFFVGNLF